MSSLNIFRIISYIEGLSYIFLVFIAMPMKYLYENAAIVKTLGMAHGVLFVFFIFALWKYKKDNSLEKEVIVDYFVYSLTPFGFILIESALKKSQVLGSFTWAEKFTK